MPTPSDATGEPSSQGTRAPAHSLSTGSERFDALVTRMDHVDERFDALEGRMHSVEALLREILQNLLVIAQRQQPLNDA